jgi:hypothetical protein
VELILQSWASTHPVYACEPDEACFEAATARIHALQYRRVANGLLRDIDTAHTVALQTVIHLCRYAVGILDGESDQVESDQVDQVESIHDPAHPTARSTDMEEFEHLPARSYVAPLFS